MIRYFVEYALDTGAIMSYTATPFDVTHTNPACGVLELENELPSFSNYRVELSTNRVVPLCLFSINSEIFCDESGNAHFTIPPDTFFIWQGEYYHYDTTGANITINLEYQGYFELRLYNPIYKEKMIYVVCN